MSRGYRVRMGAPNWRPVTYHDAAKQVETADAIEMDVGVLEILPEAEMTALLREELAAAGWSKGQDGSMTRNSGAVEVTLSPDGRTVTARAAASRQVTSRATSEAQAASRLEEAGKRAERDLAEEVARRLGAQEGEIRGELQAALQKVYVQALRQKAASMGQIESVHEGRGADGELELTIKVRV
ncbi:hypothetical protein [Nannocystis sp. SCPEA4]|uniref:hypothetical protein n=1 Tax=Nannocystis sp. SCPEA4 TaxID=2996787 RepID=UPI00227225B7|nr:hypothetical protein [Nannocystis sp. SCPEA4]